MTTGAKAVRRWFRRLGPLNKFFVVSGIATLVGLIVAVFAWIFPRDAGSGATKVNAVQIEKPAGPTSFTMGNSNTQIVNYNYGADPRKELITAASAVARIHVKGGPKTNKFSKMGYHAANMGFGKGTQTGTIFPMVADNYEAWGGPDDCDYFIEFRMDPVWQAVGFFTNRVEKVDELESVWLHLWFLPPSTIIQGSATLTVNSQVRKEFFIPAQITDIRLPYCFISSYTNDTR